MSDAFDLSGDEYAKDESRGDGDFPALEKGWYRACIADAELREKTNEAGHRLVGLNVRFDLVDWNRVTFSYLNVVHPNEQAQTISRRQFREIATAIGLTDLTAVRPQQLEGGMLWVYLTKKRAKDPQYGDAQGFENKVADTKHVNDTPPAASVRIRRPMGVPQDGTPASPPTVPTDASEGTGGGFPAPDDEIPF